VEAGLRAIERRAVMGPQLGQQAGGSLVVGTLAVGWEGQSGIWTLPEY